MMVYPFRLARTSTPIYWIALAIDNNGGVENLSDEKLLNFIFITEDRIKKDTWYNNNEQSIELNATLTLLNNELDRRTS